MSPSRPNRSQKKRRSSTDAVREAESALEDRSDGTGSVQSDFSPMWKRVISIMVVLQLMVVTAEPLRFFTSSSRGNSPATDPVRDALAPWVEFGYMNHGYFFFAPEPGPSHLSDFRFENPDGAVRIRFPDRNAQWPRLLYHRHFMLTENLNQLWVPPVDPSLSPSDPLAESWRRDRGRYTMVRDSMCQHVAETYGAVGEVEVDRIVHELPLLDDVIEGGMDLQDPRLYVTLPDSFDEPGPVPSSAQPGSLRNSPSSPVSSEPPLQTSASGEPVGPELAPAGGAGRD